MQDKPNEGPEVGLYRMNWIDKALSFAADATLVHERVDADLKAMRFDVCNRCNRLDQKARQCKVCKCFVDAKTSALTNFNPLRLRNEFTHCPMGYWGDTDTANYYREIDGIPLIK
ncbi:MAG: hypothetical protein ACRCVX_14200 [Shewanella sp.]